MGMPLQAQSILKAKVVLLSFSGSGIGSKQKRACEPADILHDMYSYRNCRGLWITFVYVRQGTAEREEGDVLPALPASSAGDPRYAHKAGVVAVAGLFGGGGGTISQRSASGWWWSFSSPCPLLSVWERSQPCCWALMGEQARAAVEVLPVAKELHVFVKTLNRQCFLRQCRVALASYRRWH